MELSNFTIRKHQPIRYTRTLREFGQAISFAGARSRNRTSADGKYLIIGNEGNEFIVTDGSGVYKTAEQIITSKVTTEVGSAATTEIKNITFNDEDAVQPLQELRTAYPDAEIYLNGELIIDFPEDVQIPIEPNQMTTAALNGNRIKFSYCDLDKAIRLRLAFGIALLKEQYAVGTIEVKVVQFKPF